MLLIESQNNNFNFTYHANIRATQRRIKTDDIDYAILHGKKIMKQGYVFHLVQNKYLESNSKAKNLIVITDHDDNVISMYKNENASRKIKRKLEYLN